MKKLLIQQTPTLKKINNRQTAKRVRGCKELRYVQTQMYSNVIPRLGEELCAAPLLLLSGYDAATDCTPAQRHRWAHNGVRICTAALSRGSAAHFRGGKKVLLSLCPNSKHTHTHTQFPCCCPDSNNPPPPLPPTRFNEHRT